MGLRRRGNAAAVQVAIWQTNEFELTQGNARSTYRCVMGDPEGYCSVGLNSAALLGLQSTSYGISHPGEHMENQPLRSRQMRCFTHAESGK